MDTLPIPKRFDFWTRVVLALDWASRALGRAAEYVDDRFVTMAHLPAQHVAQVSHFHSLAFYDEKTGRRSSLPGDAKRFGLAPGSAIVVEADGRVEVHHGHGVVMHYPPDDPEAIRLRACFGPIYHPGRKA